MLRDHMLRGALFVFVFFTEKNNLRMTPVEKNA